MLVNVNDFRAPGYPERKAIEDAMDAVGGAGGGIVYFPPGRYVINIPDDSDVKAGIQLTKSNVIFRGAGTLAGFSSPVMVK